MNDEERLLWCVETAPKIEKVLRIINYKDWEIHLGIYFKITGREDTNIRTEFSIDPDGFVKDGATQILEFFDNLLWLDQSGILGNSSAALHDMLIKYNEMKDYYRTHEYIKRAKEEVVDFLKYLEKMPHDQRPIA
jgi:hypothetical protein